MLTPPFVLFCFYYFISYGSNAAFVCLVALDLSRKPSLWVFLIDSAVMPVHSLYHTALSHHKHHKRLVSPMLQGISQSGTAASLMGQRDRAGSNKFHQTQADTAALSVSCSLG